MAYKIVRVIVVYIKHIFVKTLEFERSSTGGGSTTTRTTSVYPQENAPALHAEKEQSGSFASISFQWITFLSEPTPEERTQFGDDFNCQFMAILDNIGDGLVAFVSTICLGVRSVFIQLLCAGASRSVLCPS